MPLAPCRYIISIPIKKYSKKAMKTKRQKIPNPDILLFQYVDWVSNCQEMLIVMNVLNSEHLVYYYSESDS